MRTDRSTVLFVLITSSLIAFAGIDKLSWSLSIGLISILLISELRNTWTEYSKQKQDLIEFERSKQQKIIVQTGDLTETKALRETVTGLSQKVENINLMLALRSKSLGER